MTQVQFLSTKSDNNGGLDCPLFYAKTLFFYLIGFSYIAYVNKDINKQKTIKIIQMGTADLYTEITIKLTINESIDARTYNDSELLEDWIYCNVTDYRADWKSIEITKEELTNIEL